MKWSDSMIKIQTITDLNALKQQEHVPNSFFEEIEQQFLAWNKELNGEVLDEFSLPPEACMYHFDRQDDVEILFKHVHEIEYVDVEEINDTKFFRIGLMQDHQMSLIFVLADNLPQDIKEWLHELGSRQNV